MTNMWATPWMWDALCWHPWKRTYRVKWSIWVTLLTQWWTSSKRCSRNKLRRRGSRHWRSWHYARWPLGLLWGEHVLRFKGILDHLARLGIEFQKDIQASYLLGSLTPAFDQFVINYNMHSMDKTIMELHGMLQTTERSSRVKTRETMMVNKKAGGCASRSQRLPTPWPRPKGLWLVRGSLPWSESLGQGCKGLRHCASIAIKQGISRRIAGSSRRIRRGTVGPALLQVFTILKLIYPLLEAGYWIPDLNHTFVLICRYSRVKEDWPKARQTYALQTVVASKQLLLA